MWLYQIILFSSLSLLGLWCHSFSPHYASIHQDSYGHLILRRTNDYWILRLNGNPCSPLRYMNLLIPVVVTETKLLCFIYGIMHSMNWYHHKNQWLMVLIVRWTYISKFINIKTFGFIHLFFTILLLLDGYWINIGRKVWH
jgi:hypothetical protein